MMRFRVTFRAVNSLGENMIATFSTVPFPGLWDWMEADLYADAIGAAFSTCDWDLPGVAFTRPNTTGEAKASNPAAPSNSFLLKSSFRAMCSVMMYTILFLRSDPVTPETQ